MESLQGKEERRGPVEKFRKYVAALLLLNMILTGGPVALFAADVSNITGVTPVQQDSHYVYNISAEKISSDTGFRSYEDFQLADNDIANLLYTSEYSRFVNMVRNQVQINGLLNTLKDNNFYDGHAIFVSPGGIVIGAEGMVNVGKLSMISTDSATYGLLASAYNSGNLTDYVPGASGYNALITNAAGDIIVNGRVLTTSGSDLHAGNISVVKLESDATINSVGLTSTTDAPETRNYADRDAATERFNQLVNAQVESATGSTVRSDGTVVISNVKADARDTVTVSNVSNFAPTQYKLVNDEPILVDSSSEEQRNVGSAVLVDNSTIDADKINIDSSSSSAGEVTLHGAEGTQWSIIWDFLYSGLETGSVEELDDLDEKIKGLFSSDPYKYFHGGRSASEIIIANNSNLKSEGDMRITTNSSASFKVSNATEGVPDILYTFGTSTKSKIRISDSILEAGGKATVEAKSNNALSVNVTRTKGVFLLSSASGSDAYNFSYFNFATVADTGVDIKGSTVSGAQTDVTTTADANEKILITNSATVGKNMHGTTDAEGHSTGGSGAVLSIFVNNASLNNHIGITDSTVEARTGDLNVKLGGKQNLSTINRAVTSDKTVQAGSLLQNLTDDYAAVRSLFSEGGTEEKFRTVFSHVFGLMMSTSFNKSMEKLGDAKPEEFKGALFKAGGAMTFNNIDSGSGILVDSATLRAAGKMTLLSDLTLAHSNSAFGDATKGMADIVGAGIGLIYDNVDVENLILVTDNSLLDAGTGLDVDAATTLPGNKGMLNFGPANKLFSFYLDFEDGKLGKFDFQKKDLKANWLRAETLDATKWKPRLYITGYFENQVSSYSSSKGDSVDVSISTLIAKKDINTRVDIRNSTLKSAAGNIGLKATNTMSVHSGVGILEFGYDVLGEVKQLTDLSNTDGTGGGVMYMTDHSDAEVRIDNSEVTASDGDVTVDAANDQFYLNLVKMGAKADNLGIAGMASVQEVKGTTRITVGNSTKITGNNVRIDAGGGETQDRMTIVDINGAYSDSTEGGIAIGAAVNVKELDRKVDVLVENTDIISRGNVAVNAQSADTFVTIALAGSYSEGGAQAAAGNQAQADIQEADDAAAQNMNVEVEAEAGQAEGDEGGDAAQDAVDAVNNAGNAQNRSHFSLAAAGSVNVVLDTADVTATVRDSKIDAQGAVDVDALMDNLVILAAGGFSDSTKIGAGGAANLYLRSDDGKVISAIEDSEVKSGEKVSVTSDDDTDIYSFAAGVGVVTGSGEGAKVTLGGSFDYNTVKPDVDAHISGSAISGQSEEKQTDVVVKAEASSAALDFSGGFSGTTATGLSVGAAMAATVDHMGTGGVSYISGSTLTDNIKDVSVTSSSGNETVGVAFSAAAATKPSTDVKFDGSLGIVLLNNDMKSEIKGTDIDASGNVTVLSDNDSKTTNVAGTLEYSGSSSGVGVNGAVVINKQVNRVDSSVDARTGSGMKAGGSINIAADSVEQLNTIPVTAAISKGTSMTASNVVVNIVDNSVTSTGKGILKAEKDVIVNANDGTYMQTRGGTVGVSASGEGLAVVLDVTVNFNSLGKTVDSTIKGAQVDAGEDVSVTATAVDAIGASKEGGKDEDELLVRDADGYYSALRTDKNFFQWNMIYNVGVTTGGGAAVAGSVTVDSIKNNINASIGADWKPGDVDAKKSTINARNVNVLAVDTGINNIFAGSAAASGKYAAVGVNAIWSRNASKVGAVIKQNTILNATGDTKIDAKADRDTNFVLIGGSGNMGKGFSFSANGIYSRQTDDVKAGVDYSTIDTGSLSINADSKVDIVKVLAGVTGSEMVAISVEPIVDRQNGYTRAFIDIDGNFTDPDEYFDFYYDSVMMFDKYDSNHISAVTTRNGGIGLNSKGTVDTLDVLVSLTAAQHLSLYGMGVGHTFRDHNYAQISSALIGSAGAVDMTAASDVDIDNWSMGATAVLTGASGAANVLKNDLATVTNATIAGTDLTAGGDVSVKADSKEHVGNTAAALAGSYMGATVGLNLIFNNARSFQEVFAIHNTLRGSGGEGNPADFNIVSGGTRTFSNRTILADLSIFGVTANGAAVKTKVNSSSVAILDGFETDGDVDVKAEDGTEVNDTSVDVAGGAVGAGIGVNVFLLNDNTTTQAVIKGPVKARNIDVDSHMANDYNQVNVGINTGIGTVGVNIARAWFGDDPGFDPGADDVYNVYGNQAEEQLKSMYGDEVSGAGNGTGVLAFVGDLSGTFANDISAKGDINVSATSDIGNISMTNVSTTAGVLDVGVGVHTLGMENSTAARIAGSNVNAGGTLTITSGQKDSADMTSVGVDVAGLAVKVAGGANAYSNKSVTGSYLEDSKVTADKVSILSSIDTRADADNTGVIAALGNINVMNLGMEDEAKAESIITGTTDLRADTLELRSSGAMDLSGDATAVQIDLLNIDIERNKVKGDISVNALIDDADGTINVNNLAITTDYSKMKVSSDNNIVALTLLDVSVDNSKAYLNSTFNSGIRNTGSNSLIVNNKGTTLIETAKPTDGDNRYITTSAEVLGVNVDAIGVPVASAITRNRAESNTYLQVTEHNAQDLTINAYLNSKSSAHSESRIISALDVVYLEAEGNNESKLGVYTSGTFNIPGKMTVNTNHDAATDIGLESISLSLLVDVDVVRIDGNMLADTDIILGGTINTGEFDAGINTVRTGKLSTEASGASAVHVDSIKSWNTVAGNSHVKLDLLQLNSDRISIRNISTNTTDDVSHNDRDGLFDFGGNDYKKNFKTKSVTELWGPYINDGASDPQGTIDIIVENNNILKDSSSAGGGGFIAFKDDDYSNSFSAETELIVNGSILKAKDINLTAKSDMRTDSGDVIRYSASGGGFIVGDSISLKTTLDQTNTIRVKSGSRILATGNITMTAGSTFLFKQYVSSKDDGFMAWPVAKSKLTSNNDNNIIVKDGSKVSADKELKIYFDASGDLYTKTFAKGRNLGSKVKSYADVILNVDNTLDVGTGGSDVTSNLLHGGNYVRIDFMGSAVTNVSHESYAQCNAVVPDTKQNGETKKTVKNTFNLYDDATVETGNDMYILFDMGDGSISSWNHYKRVYYVLFGHSSTKDYYHNVTINHTPVFNMAGMVSAGYSDAWEMEIDSDGNIVKSAGFRPDNFEFIDAKDADDLKNQRLAIIMDEKLSLDSQIQALKERVGTVEGYVSEAAVDKLILNSMKDSVEEQTVMSVDELRNQVVGDLKALLVGKYIELGGGDAEYAAQLYEQVYEDYRASDYEEMSEYVEAVVTDEIFKQAYGYSSDIIDRRIINIAVNIEAPEGDPAPGNDEKDTIQFLYYTVDTSHYVGLYDTQESFVTDVNDALTFLDKELESLNGMLNQYSVRLADLNTKMEDATARYDAASALSPEYYEQTYGLYSIYFDDITRTSQGTVRIDGVGENSNKNPNDDYPASLDPKTGKGIIEIKGPGSGQPLQFYIGTGGVKVTNKSGRTLAFGSITIFGNTVKDKLTINGKVRNDLILTPGGSSPVISGITIASLLDVNHPLFDNRTNHPEEHLNNIIINGSLYTDGDQISIRTESGDIRINSMNYINGRPTSIRADQGNVTIGGEKDSDGKYVFRFYPGQEIYAGQKVTINADVVEINGKITAGLTNKGFNIINDLPLITDPLTGKNILVDLTGTGNNLKAIYRNGTYEMFSVDETEGSLEIKPVTLPISEGSIGNNGSVTVNRGFSRIYIGSIGGAQFVMHDIENTRNDENAYPALSIGNVTGNVNVHTETQMATTELYVYNNISLNGQVVNGYVRDADGNLTGTDAGGLVIGSFGQSGGITIEKVSDTEPTVMVSNSMTIHNTETGNISLNGKIRVPSLEVVLNNSTDEAIYANELENVRLTMRTAQDEIIVENSVVTEYASYQTRDKDIEVNNKKIDKDHRVDAKLYTAKTGAYSIHINGSNLVETDAPVVYNTNRDLLIKNLLGYRTFDTLALAQAVTLEEGATEISLRLPHFHEYLIDDDEQLMTIVLEEDSEE